jgi:hypothetical protein
MFILAIILKAIITLLIANIVVGIIVTLFAKDITRTSDKALEEHYKRNKK